MIDSQAMTAIPAEYSSSQFVPLKGWRVVVSRDAYPANEIWTLPVIGMVTVVVGRTPETVRILDRYDVVRYDIELQPLVCDDETGHAIAMGEYCASRSAISWRMEST